MKWLILNPEDYDNEKWGLDDRFKDTNWDESKLNDYFSESKIEFIDFEKMLKTINWRIEKLLNKDYTIGHAYFMNLVNSDNPIQNLRYIFADKIIPLLQEYFYGTFGKIELVIGSSFFIQKEEENIAYKTTEKSPLSSLLSSSFFDPIFESC